MRQTVILMFSAILVIGCTNTEDEIRSIVQQELAKNAQPQYMTSAQIVGQYTPSVKTGRFLFISGQIGISQQTAELGSDNLEWQTKQAEWDIRKGRL